MSIQTIIGEWLWDKWAAKALLTLLKGLLATLLTWLASKGVPAEMVAQIATVVQPEVLVTAVGSALFFVIDLVASIMKHRK